MKTKSKQDKHFWKTRENFKAIITLKQNNYVMIQNKIKGILVQTNMCIYGKLIYDKGRLLTLSKERNIQ